MKILPIRSIENDTYTTVIKPSEWGTASVTAENELAMLADTPQLLRYADIEFKDKFIVVIDRYNGLAERFDRTKERLEEVGQSITEKLAKKEQIKRFLAELEKQDGMVTEFDEDQWYSLIDFVTVFNKEDIRFTFKNGTEIKV